MISHKYKIIYIHIPKCGGTSIEKLFEVAPFNPIQPDYYNLVGWCPKRKLYMQHATAQELLDLELVEKNIFDSYTKFAVVRNPYSRALSDYYWHLNSTGGKGTLYEYLRSKGVFKKFHYSSGKINDYTSHIKNQFEYITIDGECVVDKIIRFENLKIELEAVQKELGITNLQLPHEKKGVYSRSVKYNRFTKAALEKRDKRDLEYFGYCFPDDL